MSNESDDTPHANGNGIINHDVEHNGAKLQRGWFRAMVQDFNPMWYANALEKEPQNQNADASTPGSHGA